LLAMLQWATESSASLRGTPPEPFGAGYTRHAVLAAAGYEEALNPALWVDANHVTKKDGNKIFITVSDNGMGIPSPIINKIFQPFFTTKPTGEGTGLGLSMSYDIISKSHGGEIKAKSKEGLGTDFEIMLPV